MKSLDERQQQRAEQKQEQKKEREGAGLNKIGGDKFEKNEAATDGFNDNIANVGGGRTPSEAGGNSSQGASGSGQDGDEAIDAKDWVNDTVENIKANLDDLSDDELLAVESAEKEGKNRTSVNDAVATEKKRREATGSNWGENR